MSTIEAFERLKLETQTDVDIRNKALEAEHANWRFRIISKKGRFVVATVASGISSRRIVQFSLTNDSIDVLGVKDQKMFSARLTLNDDGDYRFLIDGQEMRSWQLRKKALETLIFTSPWDRRTSFRAGA